MATFTKPPFSLKVVWKLFQFTKIIVSEGFRFFRLKVSVNLGVYHYNDNEWPLFIIFVAAFTPLV